MMIGEKLQNILVKTELSMKVSCPLSSFRAVVFRFDSDIRHLRNYFLSIATDLSHIRSCPMIS